MEASGGVDSVYKRQLAFLLASGSVVSLPTSVDLCVSSLILHFLRFERCCSSPGHMGVKGGIGYKVVI